MLLVGVMPKVCETPKIERCLIYLTTKELNLLLILKFLSGRICTLTISCKNRI